jgi:hypothetical protein
MRLILLAILFLLILVGGIAVALFHFFGWKGMLAFPFIVIALVWLGKFVIVKLIKDFALVLFSMKSKVLRGAAMKIHSITPVHKPAPFQADEEESENEDEEEDEDAAVETRGQESVAEADTPEEEEKPRHYYDVDLTITPRDTSSERVWEPGEFILTSEPIKSLADLEEGDKEVGTTQDVMIWDGSNFGPDDPGKYPGEQRLKLTFAVVPGTAKAWLQYYNETIASLDLPAWEPSVEAASPGSK